MKKKALKITVIIAWITVFLLVGSLLLAQGSFAWDSNLGGGTGSLQQKWDRDSSYSSSSSSRINSSPNSSTSGSLQRGTATLSGSSSGVMSSKSTSAKEPSPQARNSRVVTSLSNNNDKPFNKYLDSKGLGEEKNYYKTVQSNEQKPKAGYTKIGSDNWRVNIEGSSNQQDKEKDKKEEDEKDDKN